MTFSPKPAAVRTLLVILISYSIVFWSLGFNLESVLIVFVTFPYCLYLTIFGLSIYVTLLQDRIVVEPSFSKWLAQKGLGRERKIAIRYEKISGLDKTRWLGGYDMLTIRASAENRRRRKFGIFWKTLKDYDRFEEELLKRVPLNCKITSPELRQRFSRIRHVRPE